MVIDILASLFGTALIITSWVFIYAVGVTAGIEKATRYDHDNDPDDVIIFDHTHHSDLKKPRSHGKIKIPTGGTRQ